MTDPKRDWGGGCFDVAKTNQACIPSGLHDTLPWYTKSSSAGKNATGLVLRMSPDLGPASTFEAEHLCT